MKDSSDIFRIDEACIRFEQAWTENDTPPNIAEFLESFDESLREELISQLISIDVDQRKQSGREVNVDFYARSLPEFETLIRRIYPPIDSPTQTTQTRSHQRLRPILEQPGDMIGPYRILEKIGEGGMGVVYLAQQREPIERRVALKVIKAGLDTEQVIARFEAERQALALMNHPNIARGV